VIQQPLVGPTLKRVLVAVWLRALARGDRRRVRGITRVMQIGGMPHA